MSADENGAPAQGAEGAAEQPKDESWDDTQGDCESCKWMMGLGYDCLLGRDRSRCNNNPARRGDDELVERLLELTDDQRAKLKRRLELNPDVPGTTRTPPPESEDGL